MQYDLELVFQKNSHAFIHEYMKEDEFIKLMQKRRHRALDDEKEDQSKFLSLPIRVGNFVLFPCVMDAYFMN